MSHSLASSSAVSDRTRPPPTTLPPHNSQPNQNREQNRSRSYNDVDMSSPLDEERSTLQPGFRTRTHPRASSSREHALPPIPDTAQEQSRLPSTSESARQQVMLAMERKRRLTASAEQDDHRRRVMGLEEFLNLEGRHTPSSTLQLSQQQQQRQQQQQIRSAQHNGHHQHHHQHHHQRTHRTPTPGSNARQSEIVDLTGSSPERPLPDPLTRSGRTPFDRASSSNSSTHAVPSWQPDEEVSECPICHRHFSLFFRRHHCRKCGRVVCNECSPHRITIPRQFIVRPPWEFAASVATRDSPRINALSGADEGGEAERTTPGGRLSRVQLNPALGGGEKVRLCNPCVPDPQPDPQVIYRHHPPSPESRSMVISGARGGLPNPEAQRPSSFHLSRTDQRRLGSRESFSHAPHPGTRVQFPILIDDDDDTSPFPEVGSSRSRHDPALNNQRHGSHSASVSEGLDGSLPHPRPQTYHRNLHSRYHSVDMSRPLLPVAGQRTRGHSMLDSHEPRRRSNSNLPRIPPRSSRPPLREEDACPVCRCTLPPKGPDGDETAREAHVMECISSHDSSSSRGNAAHNNASSPRQTSGGVRIRNGHRSSGSTPTPSPPISTRMVKFTATEKDCVAEDGNSQECSICMVEYDVGDLLARLECWCKFHEECITSWFERKQECPVHKGTY